MCVCVCVLITLEDIGKAYWDCCPEEVTIHCPKVYPIVLFGDLSCA